MLWKELFLMKCILILKQMDFSMEVNIRKRHSTEFAALELVDKLLNMMDK